MGLDHSITKIPEKIESSKQYIKLRKRRFKELNENYDEFYKWEQTVASWDGYWEFAHFICRLPKSEKVSFEDGEYLKLDKCDIEFLISELKEKLKTQEGLSDILDLKRYKKEDWEHLLNTRNIDFWTKGLLEPLEKILKEVDFDKETLFYDMSF